MKLNGDFMKPFSSFYAPKAMEPPLTDKQVEKLEAKIIKEVEIAVKQVRSSKNLNANIKNNHMTRTILGKYIDLLEDEECLRIANVNKTRPLVKKEIMKLVPENYKISILPAFFNHTDGERIGTVIRDTSNTFLVDTPKKVMFSIAVKIYPYNSEVNSVRVVLVKFHQLPEGAAGDGGLGEGVAGSKGSRKARSKKSKSTKSRSRMGDPQDVPPKETPKE